MKYGYHNTIEYTPEVYVPDINMCLVRIQGITECVKFCR